MDKKKSGVSQVLSRFRGWIQAGATLLTNLHLPNFLKGGLYQGTGKTGGALKDMASAKSLGAQ